MESDAKYTTLVVDDNPAKLYTISRTLSHEGFNVVEAVNGYEAIRKSKQDVDVIILDVKLPDISGFEVCSIIKNDPETAHLPVIHLSATYLAAEYKAQGLEVGADAYLTDPVEPRVLIATIRAMLRIRLAETRLFAAARQWQVTFDAINDGVCLLDTNGVIEKCNKSFLSIVDHSPDAVIGRKLCELSDSFCSFSSKSLMPETSDPEANAPDINVSASDALDTNAEPRQQEIQLNQRWYKISVDYVTGNQGLITGMVFRMTDITELKHALQEMERSNKELEQFAYVVSHDLREPIRTVSGFTSLLSKHLKDKLEPKAQNYLNYILEGTNRMQNLITDLLKYSRISTQKKVPEEIDMNNLLGDVLFDLKALIDEKKAVIDFPPLPVIKGNKSAITQLFENLIANSLKFGGENPPLIRIKAEKRKKEWLFSIKDNGIGIEKEFGERIFVIFQRLHDREQYPGTGIGLAICKKIVEQHGGTIWVESELGKGATFYFSISA